MQVLVKAGAGPTPPEPAADPGRGPARLEVLLWATGRGTKNGIVPPSRSVARGGGRVGSGGGWGTGCEPRTA